MALNTNYTAEVGIAFNDTKLRKQLATLNNKKITLDISVKGGLSGLNKSLKTTNELLAETKRLMKSVQSSTNSLNNDNKNLAKTNDKLNVGLENTSKSAKKTADAFNHTANHGKTFSQLITDITKKVLSFGGVTQAILMVKNAFQEALNIVTEYDEALTDFTKVSDLSGKALDSYTQKLGEMGKEVFRTRTEMLNSAVIFRQAGFDEDTAAQLAKIGEMYRNVADSAISSGDSASFITSQIKAFNLEAKDAITIIDQVNEISNRFSVSSTDIANGLKQGASTLATYGNTMSQSIALISAGTEVLTGRATKVSRGLSSVGANIIKLANESGVLEYKINGTAKSINLLDESTGDLKNTFSVLSEIATGWDKMSKAEQSALALQLGG